jgi:hypothetical protein
MSIAELKFTKIVIDDQPMLRFDDAKGILGRDKLPSKYLNQVPRFYNEMRGCEPKVHLVMEEAHHILKIGDIFSSDTVNIIIKEMKQAGDNLTKINKQIKTTRKKNQTWTGDIVVKI